MISYAGVRGHIAKVTLPCVESVTIVKDPPKSIHTRRKEYVSDTTQLLEDMDGAQDRVREAVLEYARGVNPFLAVNYGHGVEPAPGQAGSLMGTTAVGAPRGGGGKLPRRVMDYDGAFRPPIRTQEQLLPLSRLPRSKTKMYTNPEVLAAFYGPNSETSANPPQGTTIHEPLRLSAVVTNPAADVYLPGCGGSADGADAACVGKILEIPKAWCGPASAAVTSSSWIVSEAAAMADSEFVFLRDRATTPAPRDVCAHPTQTTLASAVSAASTTAGSMDDGDNVAQAVAHAVAAEKARGRNVHSTATVIAAEGERIQPAVVRDKIAEKTLLLQDVDTPVSILAGSGRQYLWDWHQPQIYEGKMAIRSARVAAAPPYDTQRFGARSQVLARPRVDPHDVAEYVHSKLPHTSIVSRPARSAGDDSVPAGAAAQATSRARFRDPLASEAYSLATSSAVHARGDTSTAEPAAVAGTVRADVLSVGMEPRAVSSGEVMQLPVQYHHLKKVTDRGGDMTVLDTRSGVFRGDTGV
jgi:hypothetical protein